MSKKSEKGKSYVQNNTVALGYIVYDCMSIQEG